MCHLRVVTYAEVVKKSTVVLTVQGRGLKLATLNFTPFIGGKFH